ncbi:MAG: methyl-accepting chemotaxis protein [Gammaproteobacteria bacterium]|nr:methyl-accepting chemotaxis protein [Gammaproteobacteria bacterium]MBU2056974.1 methyl-accepting chemotaxis protein [Gammaproteobacteria bacterium]MBU2174494.1 methyl-accepting chemotaxis protein [Gammaproteobacteria bacterium]MBU2248186.1 methyl-accepting chemotaxis protein [Gammaproteobacteria bacterium]MBU2393068.1 methyl-accepting chemotaxis protein [Gammaproteobacteria bacterium]
MKLTVALRIIGGFGVISLLLLVIGITSYMSLNSINASTTQVNEISIPALENSAVLQSEFVKMSKISLQAFYATEVKQVKELESQFGAEQALYETAAKALQTVVSEEETLANSFKEVSAAYADFTPISKKLFAELSKSLSLRDQIASQLSDVELNSDDSASLLLDFSDVRDVTRRFPEASKAATELETGLNTLVSVVVDLTRTTSPTTAETISNEVTSRLEGVNQQMNAIRTEAGASVDMVADLDEKITAINELLAGDEGILGLKSQMLAASAEAQKLLTQAESHNKTALDGLNRLLSRARTVAGEIQAEAQSDVSGAITTIFLVVLISIGLAVGIAMVTVRSITVPLSKVNEILGVVASGDLTKRLDDKAQDEFGDLARNCNQVITNLRQLIQGIISRSTQLAAASEQTSAITVETTTAIREQKSQVTQAATATTEMSSTSQGVMQSSNDALAEIKNADGEAERVKVISENNKQTILQLSREVDQASTVINKLHKDSASIGSILDVIRGIAEQTNLLALNAAIEAARAGEQGRGFAVVADEVRSLASKTQASTQEIQAMIQVLQTGAHAAVEAMNKGKKQAENCVTQTEVAAQALESITNAVHLAHDMSEQISHAAKEQNQVSNEISHLLESIVTIAEQTASGAEQTSQSSHEVARLAEELRQSVDQFKV